MKRYLIFSVLLMIMIWHGYAPAMDCNRGSEYYQQARLAADPRQRIYWLQRSTAACPNFNAFYMLGRLYSRQGQPDQALDAFTRAEEVAASVRSEALALGRQGEVLTQTGQLPRALRTLELANQFHPAPAPVWLEAALRNARIQSFRNVVAAADIASIFDTGLYTSKNGRFIVRPTVNLPVHFDFDRADLNPAGKKQVWELGKALSRATMRQSSFLLVGHTDKRGTRTYNLTLSEKRAETVKKELERQFPSLVGQLQAAGRGESQLLYDGDDETDHLLNRRVKVTLIP